MRRSDIFEEFAKIAQAQGLLSEATPEEVQKKLENNPRMDSLDTSAIEALYGVKPDTPKDMEYKRNIIEDAHPKSVVVSPSYDKLNGLVENLNERQDILMHIVQKMPNGHLVQRKYAEKQLILSLVRLGNDLDNQNKEELRVLADVCLGQAAMLKKKSELVSTAIAPLVWAGIVAVPAILGAIYLQQHMSFRNEGFETNQAKLIAEIDDMISSNADWGVGVEYGATLKNHLQRLKTAVLDVGSKYTSIKGIIESIRQPRTGEELLQLAKSSQSASIISAYDTFKKTVDNYRPFFKTIVDDFKSESFKLDNIKEKGLLTQVVDWTGFLHGGKGMIADDFDDVVRALGAYTASFEETLQILAQSDTIQEDAQKKLQEAQNASTDYRASKPTTTPPATTSPTTPSRSREEIDEMSGRELADQLSGTGLEGLIGS